MTPGQRAAVVLRWEAAIAGLELRRDDAAARGWKEDQQIFSDLVDSAQKRAKEDAEDDSDAHRERPWSEGERAILAACERCSLAYLEFCEAMAAGKMASDVPELMQRVHDESMAIQAARRRLDGVLPS